MIEARFTAELWPWDARTQSWWFVTLPEALADEIEQIPRPTRGFGSVRVAVRIGETSWRTSIFPDTKAGSYVLPIKKAVRLAEGIADGGTVEVALEVVD